MQNSKPDWPDIYSIGPACIQRYFKTGEGRHPLTDKGFINAGIDDLHGEYDISRSNFDGHVVFFTVSGSGHLQTPDFEQVMTAGDIMVVPSGHPARYRIHGDSWLMIWFDIANVDSWNWLKLQPAHVQKSRLLANIHHTMELLYQELNNRDLEAELMANALLDQLIIYLKRELHFAAPTQHQRIVNRLNTLFNQVESHPQHPWTVELLAAEVAVSPSHLYALCRQHLGINPMKKVTELRMKRARLLLMYSNAPIADISGSVGYQNPFNFSNAFKKKEGCSPSEYRLRFRTPKRNGV